MTIWQEVPETSKQGIVIYNFNHDEPHTLQLNVGENVYVLRQSDDWFYGYSVNNRRQKGVFPKSYVRLKCNTWQNRQTGSHHKAALQEAQLVEEITSVLNEWNDLWKRLYIMNRSCASDFEDMRIKMTSLIDSRKLIMSSKHTVDEMKELKQRVTTQIDLGNARLGLDLVVRDEEGNILDPVMTSSVSLFRRHQVAAKKKVNRTSDTSDHKKSTSFNLFVNVKNFVCRIGDDADILMMLYDAKKGQPISENYIMKWGNQGMPRNLELLNYLSVLFTDLGLQDSNRERVFLVCLIIRLGRMDLRLPDTKKQSHGLRRPFGVAATEVTEILNGNVQADEEKQYFVPFQLCSERDFLDNVIKKVVTAKEINHKGQGVWVTMRKLQGDLKQVQKEFPHLMTNTTAIARKMGFPDVIMPDDVRYDLYVTIMQAELKRTGRSTDRNIEVTLCVCNQNGDVLQNVISEGAGGNMVSEYKTVVYYHDDKPKWCETVKVAIPIDDFYGSHLKLMFKHRASAEAKDRCERPFAMSYIKLMQDNGTTLRDTTHDLLVYKIDSKKMDQSSTYLKLPATERDLESQGQPGQSPSKCQIHAGGLTLNINDSFQISTLVCSTKLTHNVDLMGLLKWRDNLDGLKAHLCAFMQVDGEEIVKFLQDTLDALFNILMQNSDSDLYDNLVFDALIFLVSLISDRKYSQFRPVLDLYIKENFSATLAYNKLMVVLKYYIANVLDQNEHKEKLLKAMKSLEYLFKFIIRSRILFAAMNEGRGKQQFEISLKQVFQSINNLMHDTTPKTLLIQAATLKFLPTTISDVITVYNPHEFSRQLVEFLSSVPPERLTQQKMTCVNDIIHSTLFHIPDCRKVLMPFIVDMTHQLLERKQELEICVKLLCDLMDLLFRNDIGSTRSDLSVITLSGLRTVIQTVITMDRTGPLVGSCVAVMLSVLRQMTEFHYTQYIKNFETPFDLMDFLMEILMVFRDLIGKNVYPPDWVQMVMLQNSIFLKALRYFSHTIRDSFSNPFEYQVWNNFFHCAIAFLTQQSLQLEMFSPMKRDKIISKYKDMRRETAFEIRSMWFNLGQQKLEFIPEIVGPFLEMTLLPEIELRKATIPIFFDMMQYEFMSKPIAGRPKHIRGNFHTFEDEIITKLDVLVEGGRGDEQYRELFYNTIRSQCESHSTIREQGLLFVEVIKELLQRLLEYRAILNDENKENRMSCTVNLLNFYESIQRQEMYIRYLHKLCDLHLECDNYTEAAYTLLLYAKLLHWSDETLPHMLHSDKYADMETHRELKERLYYDIIDFFDKGKMWEKGIELCKELAHQGECETFDYIQLGEILQRQARFYDCIMKQMRPEPEYFRVGFYGLGFPSFLQNKVFVYRGKEYERLSDFAAGLQNQFPNAQLMRTLSEPGDDLKLSSSQYLQINSVRPIMELKPHLQNKRVHEQILKYYKVNEVQEFTFKRKKDELKNDVTTLWLDRTYLDTSYPLPGILRWFNVVSTRVEEVSPIECAIETLTTTNQKLKSLISQHQLDAGLRVDPLGMVLNGVVDAAVNGGIANYKLFYSDAYLEDQPARDNHLLVKKLRHATTLQLVLLQTALDIHKKKAHVSLQPFQAHMEQRFEQMKEFVEKEYSIKFTEEMKLSLEVRGQTRRVKTMPPQRQSEIHFGSHTVPRPANQAATRVQSTAVTRSVSTFVSAPESPTKLAKRPNFGFSGTDGLAEGAETASISSSENSSSRRNSRASKGDRDSVIIELSEQLTPQRPPRPETDRRSRPMSGHFKASPLRTVPVPLTMTPRPMTKSDSHDYDEPPPLPLKHVSLEVGGFDPETRNSTAGHKSGYFKERSSLGGSTNHSLVRAEPKKPPAVGESEV